MALSASAAPGDFPDPFVVRVPGGWGAFATNSGGRNVQVRFSPDLVSWEDRPDALPNLPGWAATGFTWSPAVTGSGDEWVLWYVAREPRSGRQAISVATADTWAGPYVDHSPAPAVFQLDLGGSIDPSIFGDAGGTRYLVWKADSNALNRPSSLWGAPLTADGTALAASPAHLLDNDRPWEHPLIEAPCLFAAASGYWLAYSAGWWESAGYGMGLAVGGSPLGPFTKLTVDRPWVASDPTAAGPGGQEIFAGDDGELRIAYHAWDPGQIGYAAGGARTLRLGRLGPLHAPASPTAGEWWKRWLPWASRAPAPDLPTVGP